LKRTVVLLAGALMGLIIGGMFCFKNRRIINQFQSGLLQFRRQRRAEVHWNTLPLGSKIIQLTMTPRLLWNDLIFHFLIPYSVRLGAQEAPFVGLYFFARTLVSLRVFSFVCEYSYLSASILICLPLFLFVCEYSRLSASILVCLRVFFCLCEYSYFFASKRCSVSQHVASCCSVSQRYV